MSAPAASEKKSPHLRIVDIEDDAAVEIDRVLDLRSGGSVLISLSIVGLDDDFKEVVFPAYLTGDQAREMARQLVDAARGID